MSDYFLLLLYAVAPALQIVVKHYCDINWTCWAATICTPGFYPALSPWLLSCLLYNAKNAEQQPNSCIRYAVSLLPCEGVTLFTHGLNTGPTVNPRIHRYIHIHLMLLDFVAGCYDHKQTIWFV